MRASSRPSWLAAALVLSVALASPPVAAQMSMAELDRLSDLTATEESGIEAAQQQANAGSYLEALATLERVMAAFPRSAAARLLHAIYLCRIDDRQGGLVEISQMDEDTFGAQNIADARNRCSRPYVEPAAPAPTPAASASQVPPGKEVPAPVAPAAAQPASSGGANSLSGSNSVSAGSASTGSSSSSSSPPPATTTPPGTDGGQKD